MYLRPARWIWYPSERCLQNTFVLFRRTLTLKTRPRRARGWISADSRYLLEINGRRVQWGPAPCDPRWLEADPIDLTNLLEPGENVIAATVLHYGIGDGTWVMGKPGFLLDVIQTGPRAEDSTMLSWILQRLKFIAPQVTTVLADSGYASAANSGLAGALGYDLISPPRVSR